MTTPCNGLPRYSGRAESCNLFGAENVAHIAHPSSDTLLGRCHELVWLRHFDICSLCLFRICIPSRTLESPRTLIPSTLSALNIPLVDVLQLYKERTRRCYDRKHWLTRAFILRWISVLDWHNWLQLIGQSSTAIQTIINVCARIHVLDCTIDIKWSASPAQKSNAVWMFM